MENITLVGISMDIGELQSSFILPPARIASMFVLYEMSEPWAALAIPVST